MQVMTNDSSIWNEAKTITISLSNGHEIRLQETSAGVLSVLKSFSDDRSPLNIQCNTHYSILIS